MINTPNPPLSRPGPGERRGDVERQQLATYPKNQPLRNPALDKDDRRAATLATRRTSSSSRNPAVDSGSDTASASAAGSPLGLSSGPVSCKVEVTVRIRPLRPDYGEHDWGWDVQANRRLTEKATNYFSASVGSGGGSTGVGGLAGDGEGGYSFDQVYMPGVSTATLYSDRVQRMVKLVTTGYNGTVFAYGQTSSGKSYTMFGSDVYGNRSTPGDSAGIVGHAIDDLFTQLQSSMTQKGGKQSKPGSVEHAAVYVSMFEIYNEQLRDLLLPESTSQSQRPPLAIRENEHGVYVNNATRRRVNSAEQCLSLIQGEAAERRVCAGTSMNERSSRSHCIIRLLVETVVNIGDVDSAVATKKQHVDPLRDDGTIPEISDCSDEEGGMGAISRGRRTKLVVSSLNLVDLAGSERVAKTGATGIRMVEGGHINKSLSTLTLVIHKLSERDGGASAAAVGHVPYRDSKLTYLLRTALGGNSRTTIIACMTPAAQHSNESRSTLLFACRAKKIRNPIKVNEVMEPAVHVKLLLKEVARLKKLNIAWCLDACLAKMRAVRTGGPTVSGNERDGLRNQIRLLSEELSELRNKSDASGVRRNDGGEHKDDDSAMREMEACVKELEGDNEALDDALREAEDLCEELESALVEKDKEVETLGAKLQTADSRVRELEADVAVQQQRIERDYEQRLKQHQDTADMSEDVMLQQLATVKTDYEKLQLEHDTLLDMYAKAEADRDRTTKTSERDELEGRKIAAQQTAFGRQLLSAIMQLGEGSRGRYSEEHRAEADQPLREHHVTRAIKVLERFANARQRRPPALTPTRISQGEEDGENDDILVAVHGLDVRGKPPSGSARHSNSVDGAAIAVRGLVEDDEESYHSAEPDPMSRTRLPPTAGGRPNEVLLRRLTEENDLLKHRLEVASADKERIIDTKLRRMQDFVLRLQAENLQLRSSVDAVVSENLSMRQQLGGHAGRGGAPDPREMKFRAAHVTPAAPPYGHI